MRVLITGGFGYVGGRIAEYLINNHDWEIILGSRSCESPPVWLPKARAVQVSWGVLSKLEGLCSDIDVIIHLAGMNAIDSANDPVSALNVNGVNTAHLLQAAINKGVKRFVYFSTAHVYSSPLVGNFTEDSCATNLHPYAASHRAGEDAVRYAHDKNLIEGVVVRLSNAFGAMMHSNVNCWGLLVNDICRQAVKTNKIILHTSGMQQRNFIAMHDVCRAIELLILLTSDNLDNGVFNVGAHSLSVNQMVGKVIDRCVENFDIRPEVVSDTRASENHDLALNYSINKLRAVGFSLRNDFSSEIDKVLQIINESQARAKAN